MAVVADDAFLSEVRRKAGMLRQGLEGLVASHPEVFELVRGSGLMLGLRCRLPVPDVIEAAYAQELCIVPAADQTVRLLPPLNIEDADIREALARLDRAAAALGARQAEHA